MPTTRRPRRRKTRKALVLGGGIAGLGTALLLERRGWQVRILERDRRPPVNSPEEAFRTWQRPGLPQFRHSHTFLARLTPILREHFPDVLRLLRASGTVEIPLTVGTPPGLNLGPREKGDGELVLLGARRAAVEWALLEAARQRRGIEILEGLYCEGLLHESGTPPRITGVRARALPELETERPPGIPWRTGGAPRASGRARRFSADLVIDATGRRSCADKWLSKAGAPTVPKERVATGIYYFTRFYRLTGERPPGATTGLVGGDVGWLKLATFPGDDDTFSITVGTNIDDRPMRALSDPEVFEALVGAFPQIGIWRAKNVSRPLDGPKTPVLVMGGLENLRRDFSPKGKLAAHGFAAVGDSSYHSNPIYGRGVTSGLLSVTLLAESLSAHDDDLEAGLIEYYRRAADEVEPFWQHAAVSDRMAGGARKRRMESTPESEEDLVSWAWGWAFDPGARLEEMAGRAARTFLEQGFGPALREDGQVFRAAMRVMNMLEEPQDGLLTPQVLARTVPYLVRSLVWPRSERPFPGPSRREAIALIERIQSRGKPKSFQPARPRSKPALRLDSEVAGHA